MFHLKYKIHSFLGILDEVIFFFLNAYWKIQIPFSTLIKFAVHSSVERLFLGYHVNIYTVNGIYKAKLLP